MRIDRRARARRYEPPIAFRKIACPLERVQDLIPNVTRFYGTPSVFVESFGRR